MSMLGSTVEQSALLGFGFSGVGSGPNSVRALKVERYVDQISEIEDAVLRTRQLRQELLEAGSSVRAPH